VKTLGRTTLFVDGLHELAASRGNSLTIARQLVVSYTTFSPLPSHEATAVVFFFPTQLLPAASIFGSGASYAARTFLSYLQKRCQRQAGAVLYWCKGTNYKAKNQILF